MRAAMKLRLLLRSLCLLPLLLGAQFLHAQARTKPLLLLPPDPLDVAITAPASGTSVLVGQSVTFTATTSPTGGTLSWTFGDGTTATGASTSKSYAAAGTYTVTAKGTKTGYSQGVDTITLTVKAALPTISSFTASPASVLSGSATTLSWATSGASSLSLTPIVNGVAGTATTVTGTSLSQSPTTSTTYKLTATNAGGSVQATVAVTVDHAPVFAGNPGTVTVVQNQAFGMALPIATDPDSGDTQSYSITGLPAGLSFNAASHYVSGVATTLGTSTATYTVKDASLLGSASETISFQVVAATGSDGGGSSVTATDTAFTSAHAKFTEKLVYTYNGAVAPSGTLVDETALITALDVNRLLQAQVLQLAAGVSPRDQATYSSYVYGYDALGQLTSALGNFYPDANKASVTFADQTSYTYDIHGNRLSHTPAGASTAWTYNYQAGSNRLLGTTNGIFVQTGAANPALSGFQYTADGAVNEIYRNGLEQKLIYADPRFIRLPTRMVRTVADGRVVETDLHYDMSGTRVYKRDYARQLNGTAATTATDPSKLVEDRETIYLANGTETLLEVERHGQPDATRESSPAPAKLGPEHYTAYIFGTGTRLARLSWDADGRLSTPPYTSTDKPNLWPDPGFEGPLKPQGASDPNVVISAGVVLLDSGSREGMHQLSIPAGGLYTRNLSGLDPTKKYLFSIWANVGGTWSRQFTHSLAPKSDGTYALTLNPSQATTYDQAEFIEDPVTTLPEGWIPENRLGRIDWFITDHLGSTKLLVDQNGTERYSGDDDPYGISLRSFGDKDPHRYTGQILDEDQNVYYYGARYYLSEIGRFLSGDPDSQYRSLYVYVGNDPLQLNDPTGKEAGDPDTISLGPPSGEPVKPDMAMGTWIHNAIQLDLKQNTLPYYTQTEKSLSWWPFAYRVDAVTYMNGFANAIEIKPISYMSGMEGDNQLRDKVAYWNSTLTDRPGFVPAVKDTTVLARPGINGQTTLVAYPRSASSGMINIPFASPAMIIQLLEVKKVVDLEGHPGMLFYELRDRGTYADVSACSDAAKALGYTASAVAGIWLLKEAPVEGETPGLRPSIVPTM